MKIVFIGAGSYARTHMACMRNIKDVTIAGVYSRTPATAEDAARQFDARADKK